MGVVLTDSELKKLIRLIESGQEHLFYTWGKWLIVRDDVLKLDNWDCQICKAKGRRRKATIVHHVKHLKNRPDLALSVFDGEERQLLSVCKTCHEEEHPESLKRISKHKKPVTAERWD